MFKTLPSMCLFITFCSHCQIIRAIRLVMFQYGRETVERLFSVTRHSYWRYCIGLLVFVAFGFINNTIRLAINARRREIAIASWSVHPNGYSRTIPYGRH